MSYLIDAIMNTSYPFPEGSFAEHERIVQGSRPRVNVSRDKETVRVTMEVAGVSNPSEDIKVEIDGDRLTISGERSTRDSVSDYNRTEISTGPFHRILTIPLAVDTKRTSSEYKDGLLTITMPMKQEAMPRYIEVKATKTLTS